MLLYITVFVQSSLLSSLKLDVGILDWIVFHIYVYISSRRWDPRDDFPHAYWPFRYIPQWPWLLNPDSLQPAVHYVPWMLILTERCGCWPTTPVVTTETTWDFNARWFRSLAITHSSTPSIGVNFCKAARLEPRHFSNSKAFRLLSLPLFATCNAYYEAVFCGVQTRNDSKWHSHRSNPAV